MSFEGAFKWIKSVRQGGRKAISFTLTCTNFFRKERFDAAIICGMGNLDPIYFNGLELEAKKSYSFDFDTVGWDWCQGDSFVILGKNKKIEKQWTLNLKVPAPGECPECHGTKKCSSCNGTGQIHDYRTHLISYCEKCSGTGICQECYLPVRNIASSFSGLAPNINTSDVLKQRKISALRQRISELQSKLDSTEADLRIMKLRGTDLTSHSVYSSELNLKYQYQRQIQNLLFELQQLENL